MRKIILTRRQIYERERQAYEKFCIPPLILMENAGREIALEARRITKNKKERKIIVIAGPGNNGGDGMVAARHLHCSGYLVAVFFTFDVEKAKEPSFTNYKILVKMNLMCEKAESRRFNLAIKDAELIIDAIFGIGLTRNIEGIERDLILSLNNSGKYIISADIPSGIDADTGEIYGTAVRANSTISFGFGKKGLKTEKGKYYAGKIKIVDIGFPPELYF
ncbi:MAG: NAD(P)H-hydrate epimerase [Candidatus Omnitrophica bacterium]|nr:NAD(P)H-hydrate epimerase [Candidatus Omnitrophota bacterium]MCM8828966.1 NAD(P)H-hydrate epimerase [Candidatus Omnitrophota bacterium]